MRYGFGLYPHGVWFGFGQIQFRRRAIDLCLFKRVDGYNKLWLTVGQGCSLDWLKG
ncbi:hypothetical protein LCGC14_2708770 [marine sediment metagenome]|uniref:Uncharacterized protein n=1 Tax=marine sediment metagenome TaxID=412755 RepID=A0A0F8ZDL0_9ZZZZ